MKSWTVAFVNGAEDLTLVTTPAIEPLPPGGICWYADIIAHAKPSSAGYFTMPFIMSERLLHDGVGDVLIGPAKRLRNRSRFPCCKRSSSRPRIISLCDLEAMEHGHFGKVQDEGEDRRRNECSPHHEYRQRIHGD